MRDPLNAVRNYAKSLGVELPESPDTPSSGMLDVPVRPLSVTISIPALMQPGPVQTAVLYGDSHFPNHDPRVLDVVGRVVEEVNPNTLVHMGDLLDCYALSRFDKDPQRKETLQDEIDMARQHLAQMRLTAPDARFILLEGNHEDRLRRILWNLPGTANALSSLTEFRNALTWPKLLGLDALYIGFAGYNDGQAKRQFLPKWILKHGSVVRKYSGYTARGEMEKYGRSGSSGHTHRLAAHFHQDHNGNHCWVETGCTCLLTPEYMQDPDWQQGCVVLTFEPETGAFSVEPIYIHNGLAVWRGNIIRA